MFRTYFNNFDYRLRGLLARWSDRNYSWSIAASYLGAIAVKRKFVTIGERNNNHSTDSNNLYFLLPSAISNTNTII
jgi:hypothetical protein